MCFVKESLAAIAILVILMVLGKAAVAHRRRTSRQNKLRQAQLDAILNNIPHPAWFKDPDGRYIAVNQPLLNLLEVARAAIIGRTALDLWPEEEAAAAQNEDRRVLTTGRQTIAISLKTCRGREVWLETYKSPVFSPNGEFWGTTGISLDVTERKKQREELRRLAYFDNLTNLPNRKYIEERLAAEMESARHGSASGAVLFVDMDDLKLINDKFGHSYGDEVIKIAGARILAEVGENAVVARVGGDEYIILLPNADTQEKAGNLADQIIRALTKEYVVGDQASRITVSTGIALYPSGGTGNADDIIKNAEAALYVARKSGKNNWCFYEAEMLDAAYENMLLKHSLRDANKRGELSVYYQPQITIEDSAIVGYEALLRWHSPEHGFVPPARFIPWAEESEVIKEIGGWVLDKACEFARSLAGMGKGHLCVWVNVSPRQLNDENFVSLVGSAIANAKINPGQLGLEITENVLIGSLDDCIQKLRRLHALGVNFSLDDFGTGYSSLTYLRSLPVNTIKLDKSFIDELADDEAQVSFVRLIVDMAHKLGIKVIAEGVETELQVERLKKCHCDYIQGYIFSRPVPPEEAVKLLTPRPS
jgi:diguanylate cyclase (GGDEF)-like protein/PAS domain S-box-containing protein